MLWESHLEFRCEIAICLLKSPMDVYKKTTGGAVANLPSDLRYDLVDHFKVSTTQGQCKICHKNTCYISEKCIARLHSDKVRCVLRCIIHIYKSDSIQKTFISLYV